MFIIGITGGTGAGKTSALRALRMLGALCLDCDAIYHELLSDNAELNADLGAAFNGVLSEGRVDRKLLGEIVFSDPAALLALNSITHKYVSFEIERRLAAWEALNGKIAAIDAIALIESSRSEQCNVVVGVIAPRESRISRIMVRDGITRGQAELRINAQKPDSFFRERCDYILENTYSTSKDFERNCKKFFTQLIGGNSNAG